MAYQALYRRWRPADFDSMVGQENVVATLRNQVTTGRIAHAYLFCGSRGTGKTSAAKILARAVNCEQPMDGNPCGECPTCQRILREETLDVSEIDAASNNGVDEIRDLRETVKYPPQDCRYKVYIIDEVHMLSSSAFNALLKTLEEPPAHVVFILATTEPQKLPATVLSRCQRFDFKRIPVHQIVERLREVTAGSGATAEDAALTLIARAAEGGMRDALSILDMCLGCRDHVDESLVRDVLGTADRGFLFRFGDCLAKEDAAGMMEMIDELMRSGREPVVFAKDISRHLRSLLMAKACPEHLADLLETTGEDAQAYARQAESFTISRLTNMMELFMAVETNLRYASSPRLALETAAVRACLRTGEEDGAALRERIEQLEKQLQTLQTQLASGVVVAEKPRAAGEKPEKQPESKPEKPALPPVPGSDNEVWKKALEEIGRSDPGTFPMLSLGKLVGVEDDCFHWESQDKRNDNLVSFLNADSKKNSIAARLTEIRQRETRFQAHSCGGFRPEKKQEKPEKEPFLGELLSTFGKENVIEQETAKKAGD